jgi:DNA polymerase epsilon subunit 2
MQARSKIVLVPAPSDPGSFGTLPQRPLPTCVAQPLLDSPGDVILASNPCRLQFYTKQIVICLHPRLEAFSALSLLPAASAPCICLISCHAIAMVGHAERQLLRMHCWLCSCSPLACKVRVLCAETGDAEDDFERSCHTVLSQRHLSPFPLTVQPVHWDYDNTLTLFPQPEALVLPYQTLLHNACVHDVRCGACIQRKHVSAGGARSLCSRCLKLRRYHCCGSP